MSTWPFTLSYHYLAFSLSTAKCLDVPPNRRKLSLPKFTFSDSSLISAFLLSLSGTPGGLTSLEIQLWSGTLSGSYPASDSWFFCLVCFLTRFTAGRLTPGGFIQAKHSSRHRQSTRDVQAELYVILKCVCIILSLYPQFR